MNSNVVDLLLPIGVLGIIGFSIVSFVKILTSYFLRKKMIEKGYVNEEAQALFRKKSVENKYASLKYGLIIFFGGLSLIIMEFVPVDPGDSPFPYGLFALFIALGFLVYFFMVQRFSAKEKL